jgi:hypothetical protein
MLLGVSFLGLVSREGAKEEKSLGLVWFGLGLACGLGFLVVGSFLGWFSREGTKARRKRRVFGGGEFFLVGSHAKTRRKRWFGFWVLVGVSFFWVGSHAKARRREGRGGIGF